MTATITIYGAQSVITGDYPKSAFTECTSYAVEGAQFSPSYKKGVWDGRKNLARVRTGSFPTGLLPIVKEMLAKNEIQFVVDDKRQHPGRMDLFGPTSYELANGIVLRDYQLKAAKAAVENEGGILKMATGSGKTFVAAGIIVAHNVPTLFLVPTRELLYQTRAEFLKAIPNATEASIGVVGDGEWEVGTFVTVATVSTLHARLATDECAELLKSVDCIIADECHGSGADEYYEIVQASNAYYKYGMSGTPYDRTDGGTLRLIASFGEKVADVGYKELVDAKVLPRAKIIFDKITGPILPKKPKLTYAQVYKQGVVESDIITQHVVDWTRICVAQGLAVMILVDQIEHGKLLDEALWLSAGELIPHAFIHGTSSNRDEALQEFKDKEISVLIASSILDTGISIDGIDVLIPVGARKSKIRTLQKLGRALRGEKAIVIEFFNMTHKFLMDHSQIRFRDYLAEDCFVLKQSAPNAELIKRLWEMP